MNAVMPATAVVSLAGFARVARHAYMGAGIARAASRLMPLAICCVALICMVLMPPLVGLRCITIALMLSALTVCAITDLQTGYVFDLVTLPAVTLILISQTFMHAFLQGFTGALAVAAVPLALFLITRGRGIGLGDAKLALCVGAALGPRCGLISLAIAFIIGGAIAAMMLVFGTAKPGHEMRFAPFMAIGAFAVTFAGL